MIFTERTVKIKNGVASIDAPIILYRGDRQVEILFKIIDSKYKFSSEQGNYIKNVEASFGQLAIDCPDGSDVFTEVTPCIDGAVTFTITGEMIDELYEVGFYSFHIRLFNNDQSSRITIPPIMKGIEIREPMVIEGDDYGEVAMVNYGQVDKAIIENEQATFLDENGNLNIEWKKGDIISSLRLNQMIGYINDNAVPGEKGDDGYTPIKGVDYFTTADKEEMLSGYALKADIPTVPITNSVKMIAHRGFSSEAPENTIPAFELAGMRGYWGAECDILETSDGYFVLMHDDTVDRTTNGTGNVSDMTLEQIKSLNITVNMDNYSTAEVTVPTLEEYLICCKQYNLVPVIEIKSTINVANFIQIIREYGMENKVIVICFDNNTLINLRNLSDKIKIQTLTFVSIEQCLQYNFDIDINYTNSWLTEENVKLAHNSGIEINVWTVDELGLRNNLISMGVDYITTNRLQTIQNIGNRTYENESNLFKNNKDMNTLASLMANNFIINDIITIDKLTYVSRLENKKRIYPKWLKKEVVATPRVVSEPYSILGCYNYKIEFDSTFKLCIYSFNDNNHIAQDSGWLTNGQEISLPDTASFIVLFGGTADDTNCTIEQIEQLRSSIKLTRLGSPMKAYDEVSTGDVLKFMAGKGSPHFDAMIANGSDSMNFARAMDATIKPIEANALKVIPIFDDTKIKLTVLPFSSEKYQKEDLGWMTSGTEYALPDNTAYLGFYFGTTDGANFTDDIVNYCKQVKVKVIYNESINIGKIIPTKLSQLTNDSSYATENYVTNAIANAQLGNGDGNVDLSNYTTKEHVPKINLPAKLYALVDEEFNIYFDNILEYDYKDYHIRVICNEGSQLDRCYRITPTTSGEIDINIQLYDKYESFITQKTSKVIKSTKTQGDGVTKSVLILGDSTTANGIAVSKLIKNFEDDSMNITMLGTLGDSNVKHEGRSGWTYEMYYNKNSYFNNTNAFYNPDTSLFDYSYYCNNTNTPVPDYFILNLGINDVYSYLDDANLMTRLELIKQHIDHIVSSIQQFDNNVKVCIALTIPPNYSQNGFYNQEQTRNRCKRNNALLVNELIKTYDNRESERIYLIPLHCNLDTEYNFGLVDKVVNKRSTITYKASTQGSHVHPDESGYWQCADSYWFFLKSLVSM